MDSKWRSITISSFFRLPFRKPPFTDQVPAEQRLGSEVIAFLLHGGDNLADLGGREFRHQLAAELGENLAFEDLEVLVEVGGGEGIVLAGHRAGDAAVPAATAFFRRDHPALGGAIALLFPFRFAHVGRLRRARKRVDAKPLGR
jgi:hypothetical protein